MLFTKTLFLQKTQKTFVSSFYTVTSQRNSGMCWGGGDLFGSMDLSEISQLPSTAALESGATLTVAQHAEHTAGVPSLAQELSEASDIAPHSEHDASTMDENLRLEGITVDDNYRRSHPSGQLPFRDNAEELGIEDAMDQLSLTQESMEELEELFQHEPFKEIFAGWTVRDFIEFNTWSAKSQVHIAEIPQFELIHKFLMSQPESERAALEATIWGGSGAKSTGDSNELSALWAEACSQLEKSQEYVLFRDDPRVGRWLMNLISMTANFEDQQILEAKAQARAEEVLTSTRLELNNEGQPVSPVSRKRFTLRIRKKHETDRVIADGFPRFLDPKKVAELRADPNVTSSHAGFVALQDKIAIQTDVMRGTVQTSYIQLVGPEGDRVGTYPMQYEYLRDRMGVPQSSEIRAVSRQDAITLLANADRKSVVQGKSVDRGGARLRQQE